jgi:hypothetical protein
MMDVSKAIGQTKKDTLALQVGGEGMKLTASSLYKPWMAASEVSTDISICNVSRKQN